VGCSIGYVNKMKSELFTSEKLPDAPATVTGKDGKTYPTRKPRPKPEPQGPPVDAQATTASKTILAPVRAMPRPCSAFGELWFSRCGCGPMYRRRVW
jgi:hypothetical protein